LFRAAAAARAGSVVAEFAALQQQFTQIDLDVRATDLPIDLSTFPGRLVFLKKDKKSY